MKSNRAIKKKRVVLACEITRVLSLMTIVFITIILVYVFFASNAKLYEAREPDGYTEMTDFTCKEVKDTDAPLGMKKIYTKTLDSKIVQEECIAFYVVHQYVQVYMDDELLYDLENNKQKKFGRTTGSNWILIPFQLSDEGKEMRIVITPVYSSFEDRKIDFLIGDNLAIYTDRLKKDLPQIVMSGLAIMIGLLFIGVSLYNYIMKKYDTKLAALGTFAVLLGVWKLTDTRFTPFMFQDNPHFVSCVVLVSLMMAALPLTISIKKQFSPYKYPIMDYLCLGLVIADLVVVLLQFFNLIDFREMILVSHLSIFIAAIVSTAVIIYDRLIGESNWLNKVKSNLFLLCIAGSMADVLTFYVKGNSSGIIFTLLTFLIYIILTGIAIISGYVEQEKKMRLQEQEMANNRISIMLSQIQPHFLYNTLNSIYYLCGKDAEAARKAISDFSDYLRTNLDSIKKTTPVLFETELRHVQIYLSLEKMRFEEELNIIYDTQCMDFMIPALSVQPLVENAVKYGVGKKIGGGTVKIVSHELNEYYEVVIADDGVGYHLQKKQEDGRTHIGIENVRKRLWAMSRATLEITSVEAVGTKAVIRIPKSEKS